MAGRAFRTAIKIAVKKTVKKGKTSTDWEIISLPIGGGKFTQTFYCEWLSSYGAVAIQQQADGVTRVARIRMPFIPQVYEALISKAVRVYKDGIVDEAHTFVLASSADDLKGEHKIIEYQVKKYEGK